VDVLPSDAQSEVWMQTPDTPFTEHDGGGVQHSTSAAPGQSPAVDV
jgi:hypothetical protein